MAVRTAPKKARRVAPRTVARAKKRKKRGFLRRIWWLWVPPIALGTAMAVALTYVYFTLPLPPEPAARQTTFLFDQQGRLLTTLHGEVDRTLIPLEEMPDHLRQAVIAAEDEKFYSHVGIDPAAIIRAAWANLRGRDIEQGASTITQQYVRNAFPTEFGYELDPEATETGKEENTGGFEKTVARKLKEALLAIKLERKLSKDEILERYLNTIYLGRGAYGVQAAAQKFFATGAKDLTLLQSATLAGLISSPEANSPVRYPERAKVKRDRVLRRMVELRFITAPEAERLIFEPVKTVKPKKSKILETQAAYFVDYTKQYLERKFGYEQTFAGGLRVVTSLDRKMQRAAEQAVAGQLYDPGDPDAALVAIDPRNGEIKAMVGGKDFRRAKFNLATFRGGTGRQTGSAFKMFTLAAAVDKGISLKSRFSGPGRVVIDDPQCYSNGEPWDPSNYSDSGAGTMDLFGATTNSVNTIFAQLVVEVGPRNVARIARKMGITSPLDRPVGSGSVPCSITLGTLEVTPLDMAVAFSTLASGGIRHDATPVKEVKTPDGEVLQRSSRKGVRALDVNDAWQVVAALEGPVCCGTGTAANIGVPQFGKTGTAENHADAYFCGGTRVLVTCVWVGHRKARIPLFVRGRSVTGGYIPAQIWHDFMLKALAGVHVPDFPQADFIGKIVKGKNISTTPSPTPEKKKKKNKKKRQVIVIPTPITSPSPPPPPPPPAACADGLDNDADGLTDFGMDPDCTAPEDADEAVP